MNFKQLIVLSSLALPLESAWAFPKDFKVILTDTTKKAPTNWFNLDANSDKIRGVSTEKAYQNLLKDKKSTTVIVGIIDSGIEIDHEDLKGKIWVNEKEIPNNGIDDDKNGYIDDINGWDFIGGKDGKDVSADTYELTREYAHLKKKYEGKEASQVSGKDKTEFDYFKEIEKAYQAKVEEVKNNYDQIAPIYQMYQESMKVLRKEVGKESISQADIDKIKSTDSDVQQAKQMVTRINSLMPYESYLDEAYKQVKTMNEYQINLEFDPRNVVGDNYANVNEKGYGNNEVEGPDADHGTHVAGIIGANRENNLGMKGVANDVKIMVLRAVPDGDERDKDIANAIRYAVDNGAKVVNMSFGKDYSPEKSAVDEAVKYAEQKGVLLVHAAGNDGEDIDVARNFPTKRLLDGKVAKNWIEVGASSWGDDKNFVASFSNYGQNTVDVFAPGVAIYSSVPDQKYAEHDGTSMAAPVVTGIAALVMSYYPNLTAEQVRDIILKSSVKYVGKQVNKPGTEDGMTDFAKLSNTAGIANVFEALQMAETMSKGGKVKKSKEKKPKKEKNK